jgi:hypothetical protein
MSVVNDDNRQRLLKNPNVKSVGASNVTYTSDFMKLALQQYLAGVSGRLIWSNGGFNLDDFLPDYFRKVLKRWQRLAHKAGDTDWTELARGRKKKILFSDEREELEYLRAENKFLKELRALGSKSR